MSEKAVENIIIAYHADCIDGAASAWAVTESLQQRNIKANITYVPYEHSSADIAEDSIRAALSQPSAKIYFVDVAPEKHFLDELMTTENGRISEIHVLDHHKSAGRRLKYYTPPALSGVSLEIKIEDKEASAARMIWMHLMPTVPVPPVFDVIHKMDGDAAGLKTPEDFAAAALIDSHDIRDQKRAFDTMRGLVKMSFNDMAQKGQLISADQEFKLDQLMDQASFVTLQLLPDTDPVRVPIINGNVQHFGRRISERMVELAKKKGANIALAWFVQKSGKVTMSLRSDGDPDLSDVIAHLTRNMNATGGGHATAGAMHFASLFEFARQIHLEPPSSRPNTPKTDGKPPHQ